MKRQITAIAFIALVGGGVPGCAALNWINSQFTTGSAPQANSVYAAEQFYTITVNTVTDLRQKGAINDAAWAKIKGYDTKVYNALGPLRQAAEANNGVIIPALLDAYNAAYGNLYKEATADGATIVIPANLTTGAAQ